MKQRKIVIRCLLGSMAAALMFPMASYAQTVTPTTDNSQLIAVLTALVQVLEQEIAAIEMQSATTTPPTVQGAPDTTATSAATTAAVPAATHITSTSTSAMTDETQQAPQFAQAPIFQLLDASGTPTTNGNLAASMQGTWSADVAATAVLYRSTSMASMESDPSDYSNDQSVQIAESWDTPATTFTFTSAQPMLQNPWFYTIVITANGMSTAYHGGGNPMNR